MNPGKAKQDAECVYHSILANSSVGVYGRSIGGIAACHIAHKFNLDFIIADRTLDSLSGLIKV